MKKSIVFALSMMLVAGAANAEQISTQQAEAIATQFVRTSTLLKDFNPNGDEMTVAYTAARQGMNLYHVVNNGTDGGYVVVAGDDIVSNVILGYTDNGTFDYDTAPENLKWWLSEYGRQIEYMLANETVVPKAEPTYFETSVAPLVTTRWDQDEPYNDLCNGYYTGCVATAMAQVMNYHEWPVQGTGSHSYFDFYSGRTWSADFGQTTYDWDNMLDTYTQGSNQAQRDAVATLMLHCGVSVNMQYMGSQGSGAYSEDVATALMDYFGYPENVQIIYRDYYTYDEWIEIMTGELDASRPICYGGYSSGGGHQFVIDGYNTNGYFHLNWGWGGTSDGYYLIATLNPYSQGIGGGSDSGFKYEQDAIINVQPPVGGEKPLYEINADGFSTSNSTVAVGGNISTTLTTLVNMGCRSASFNLGILIRSAEGDTVATLYNNQTLTVSAGQEYGTRQVSYTLPAEITDGTYRIYPVYRHSDDHENTGKVHILNSESQSITMVVADGVATLSASPTARESLSAENIIITENPTLINGETTVITVDMVNTGTESFCGNLGFAILEEDSDNFLCYGTFDRYGYSEDFEIYAIMPGVTNVEMSLRITFNANKYYYRIAIIDEDYQIIGTPQLVKVVNPSITLVETPEVESLDYISASDIRVNAALRNTSSEHEYQGRVQALIYKSGRQLAVLDTEEIVIPAGETVDVSFAGAFPDAVVGESYMLYIYNCAGNALLPPGVPFTVATMISGINDVTAKAVNSIYPNPVTATLNITAGAAIEQVAVYSLSGSQVATVGGKGATEVRIDMTALPAGTYLVRIVTADGVQVEKVVKK